MPLVSKVEYRTSIKNLKDIPPESVLLMLDDVRACIGQLDSSFTHVDMRKVLEIVEEGRYEVDSGGVVVNIDLSSAKNVIKIYREYSEGGCQSCMNLGRETIDAQDGSYGLYCQKEDPDYHFDSITGIGVRYEGFSPKIGKYYEIPCESWKPRFSPKLEEIIMREG